MNVKRILFEYVFEHEVFTTIKNLEEVETQFINSLSKNQKILFDKYYNLLSRYHENRLFYYFCKGIKIHL